MSITGNWDRRINRRDFLAMTSMSAAALALGTNGLLLPRTALAASSYPSGLGAPFTLGIASGDPRPDGVVLWTRLAPTPLSGGGMGSTGDVNVDWEVATALSSDGKSLQNLVLSSLQDTQNGTVAKQNPAVAYAAQAHSVHLEVGVDTTKLPTTPERIYYYRFMVRDSAGNLKYASTIGRTKTAPAPDAALTQMKFAVASCQSYQAGYWAPFLDIATNQDDLDCVVHVGDYTYEYGRWTGYSGPWKLYRTAATTNLATYRNRHAEYKYAPYEPQEGQPGSDTGLQDAHAAHPWICVWDDHEVVNDYAGGDLGQNARRNAAYQAYYEHMPIRPSRIKKTDWSSVELYHDIAYGNLARFCVLDTRQYRSKHACKTTSLANCSDRFKPTLNRKQHTILGRGDAQETWLKSALSDSSRPKTTWKVLTNQVRMMGYDHAKGSAESYRMEEWDGYVATRNRISEHIYKNSIKNTVSVTGDLHCAFAADLKYNPGRPNDSYKPNVSGSETIGAELIGTSVCSDLGGWRDTYEGSVGDNPHVKYLNTKEGGYLLCTLDANTLEAEYRRVKDGGAPLGDGRYSPTSGMETIATATVVSGTPGLLDGSVSGAGSVSLSPEVTAEEQPRRKKSPRAEPPRGRDTR